MHILKQNYSNVSFYHFDAFSDVSDTLCKWLNCSQTNDFVTGIEGVKKQHLKGSKRFKTVFDETRNAAEDLVFYNN